MITVLQVLQQYDEKLSEFKQYKQVGKTKLLQLNNRSFNKLFKYGTVNRSDTKQTQTKPFIAKHMLIKRQHRERVLNSDLHYVGVRLDKRELIPKSILTSDFSTKVLILKLIYTCK